MWLKVIVLLYTMSVLVSLVVDKIVVEPLAEPEVLQISSFEAFATKYD